MNYLSVCSGIEAASVAWEPLGWKPVAFSEIEPFPCAVLAHRFLTVPNYGDMTKFKEWPDATVDVLVGGTPCQSFSVAGLRKGLADPRGNLTLTYLAMVARYRPRWVVWENVPGVLSDKTGGFAAFVGGLAELGYWWAYRVLDAQFFGVPQRRRRVFVVGHSGDWRRAAAVFSERESLLGNPPPRREAGKGTAKPTARRLASGNDTFPTLMASYGEKWGLGDQEAFHGDHHVLDSPMFVTSGQANCAVASNVALALNSTNEAPYIAHSLRGDGFDASEDGTGRGTPLVPVAFSATDYKNGRFDEVDVSRPVTTSPDRSRATPLVAFAQNQRDEVRTMDVAGSLAGEPGMKQQTYIHSGMSVRRLTPVECERLQGFPDNWTLVHYRGKPAADGPRYKAIGNSMAVPCMRWIGKRIAFVDSIP